MFKKLRVFILFSAAFALVGVLINRFRQEQTPPGEKMEILVPTDPQPGTHKASALPQAKAVKPLAKPQPADDLTRITGIGPKISTTLQEAGVNTFKQLAALTPQEIRQILGEAGVRIGKPDDWPEQAKQAAAG